MTRQLAALRTHSNISVLAPSFHVLAAGLFALASVYLASPRGCTPPTCSRKTFKVTRAFRTRFRLTIP